MKHDRALLLPLLAVAACAASRAPAPAASVEPTRVSIGWESPNGWKGGAFSLPPRDFAPKLGYRGREVLRFSPGFYAADAPDVWTYAFAFFVDDTTPADPEQVDQQLRVYFRGLGANLGSEHDADLSLDTIVVRAPSTAVPSREHEYRMQIDAFDSWNEGDAITLNIEWQSWLCDGGQHRALLFLVSPLDYGDPAWALMRAERSAITCASG